MAESMRPDPGSTKESPESAEHAGLTLQEWLDRVAAGNADSLPQVKGKREKAAFASAIGELAVSAAFGDYKSVKDKTGFESGLKAYAQARARGVEERVALLRAVQDVDERDIEALKRVQATVETKLQRIGVQKSAVTMPEQVVVPAAAEPTIEEAAPAPIEAPVAPEPEVRKENPPVEPVETASPALEPANDQKRGKRERNKDRKKKSPPSEMQKDVPDYAALKSVEEIRAKYGESKQVGRIPYWPLPQEAMILDKLNSRDDEARAYRIGDGGMHRFPLGWYRYDASKLEFERIPDDELAELRKALRDNLISVWGENGPEREPKVVEAPPEERAPRTDDRPADVREERRERRERHERPFRTQRSDGIPRPAKRSTGTIDGLEYWRDRNGSALIEDELNEGRVYRVQRGGLHWIPSPGESAKDLDREALYWNGNRFKVLTRNEWQQLQEERSEAEPEAEKTAEAAPAAPKSEPVARTEESPRPAPGATTEQSSLEQAARTLEKFPSSLANAIAEPKIGSEQNSAEATAALGRVGDALKRLAANDKQAFEFAQRSIRSLSAFQREEYEKLEREIDSAARSQKLSHTMLADILHEPNPYLRADRVKREIESSLGFFGRALNVCTFGLYVAAKAGTLVRATTPLVGRMKKTEEEFGRRRAALFSILDIS